MKVAIIGGGLAGCALAYVLKQNGADPALYEAGDTLAAGASGNMTGLYNPRFTAARTPQSDYYSAAFAQALTTFRALEDIDWNPCGALHLMTDDKKRKRFGQTVRSWGWDERHMRMVGMDEASEIAGIDIGYDALYLPQSGCVSPPKLCEAYMDGVEFHLNMSVKRLEDVQADAIVLACGPAIKTFYPEIPVRGVRGQLTEVQASDHSKDIKCALCYSGYFSPAQDGVHIVGSTFQHWLDHTETQDEDDVDNLAKLAAHIPGLEQGLKVLGNRAAMRAASKDHFPIVGRAPGLERVYISGAHGSHGIISSLMAAHLLSDMIFDRPYCLSRDTVAALSPERFS